MKHSHGRMEVRTLLAKLGNNLICSLQQEKNIVFIILLLLFFIIDMTSWSSIEVTICPLTYSCIANVQEIQLIKNAFCVILHKVVW